MRYVVLIFLVLANITSVNALSERKEALIKKYAAPQHIIDILEQHTDFFLKIIHECTMGDCKKDYGNLVWQFDTLPGYYVKYGVNRIKGLEKIRECIETFNLNRLTVSKKYLYHIPGKDIEFTDENYWVVAEEQKPAPIPLVINLEEAKQMFTLIDETGFYDFQPHNIIRNTDNKLAIIDTEPRFNSKWGTCFGLRRIITSQHYDLNTHFTEDALKFIMHKLIECYPPSSWNYSDKYYEILNYLELQPTPFAWDYIAFFKKLFPHPIDS